MRHRRIIWTAVWSMMVILAAAALLQPKSHRTAPAEAERVEVDPAAMGLGNSDAGAMMALINSQISLNDR